jgi:tryptophan synthase alpha chain
VSGRIDSIFQMLRSNRTTGLMPFITAGYPSLQVTAEVIPALDRAGARIVEIGLPFSDPIADGPTIAASMHEALEAGVTPAKVLQVVREVRSSTDMGLIAMVSDSIVTRMGRERFIRDAADAGIDGFIIPDLDTTTAEPITATAAELGVSVSLLVAPTTSTKRLETIVKLCSGFIYLLGRTGLTGERDESPDVAESVRAIRQLTDLPIAVGFGISTAAHVAAVTSHANAAIVGSALVRRMGQANSPVAAAETFTEELVRGLQTR